MNKMVESRWDETVILVDADYLDRLAGQIITPLAADLGRDIPAADLTVLLDCLALDAGIQPGENAVQAVLIHSTEKSTLGHFSPSKLATELNGRAFKDGVAEFTLQSFPVEDALVSRAQFFVDVLGEALGSDDVQRVAVVGDMQAYGAEVCGKLAAHRGKAHTLFVLRKPEKADGLTTQNIAFPLMQALGVSADELP